MTHLVRDKKSAFLDTLELELEHPKLINEDLIELEDKIPFLKILKLLERVLLQIAAEPTRSFV